MKVYKFGGASVRSAEGIKNIADIVSKETENLFIIISAMGKTTNAMEIVLENFMKADRQAALNKLAEVEAYHSQIVAELFEQDTAGTEVLKSVFGEIKGHINTGIGDDYDRWYDCLVSYGEVISTKIISAYLNKCNVSNAWLDMRELLVTDSNYREANVRMEESQEKMEKSVDFSKSKIYIGQGFIGANTQGNPTTLGREGSDYSAAVVGNLLDAESVTIWKDVPGILNADPRLFENTVHIPEMTYLDAVELAYSGAQIIHPKTIKPLQNKEIPLYVRPFGNPEASGSVIKATVENPKEVPVLIVRKNQVLVTIRPRDFSFVLEESLPWLFTIIHKHRLKVSLIQSSAISISVGVDNTRYLEGALDELANDFKVSYNTGMELLTIRGINPDIEKETTAGREILLSQRTRRIGRFLMKEV
ncbi:aspartate kinase [Paludibacter sp. 221]|uniref:aspartate kinase n=1 Tax=Paludibacter sp. 221 TaxID=2302939 RepID=UPI0013D67322|nr:aspartate kinase [Paludibacter sp. 221]NDV45581.1 aspartate kinase [Paludibacter sp. 221]